METHEGIKAGTVVQLSNFRDNERFPVEILSAKSIDRGGTSVIYPGVLKLTESTSIVALKVFPIIYDKAGEEALRRELRVVSKVSHNCVLEFIGTANLGGRTILIAPFMRNGNLLKYVIDNPRVDRQRLIKQVAEGVCYLHEHAGIVHGDIKCENVLVSNDGNALVADFGLSTIIEKEDSSATTMTAIRERNTLRFAAPELLLGPPDDQAPETRVRPRSKTPESDVYAFGMLVLQAFTETRPWPVLRNEAVFHQVVAGQQHPHPGAQSSSRGFTHAWWSICTKCWTFDHTKRPDMYHIWKLIEEIHTTSSPRREMAEIVPPAYTPTVPCTYQSPGNAKQGSHKNKSEWQKDPTIPSPPRPPSVDLYRSIAPPSMPSRGLTLPFLFRDRYVDINIPFRAMFHSNYLPGVLISYATIDGQVQTLAVKVTRTLDKLSAKMHQRELHMWRHLKHPRILPFYGACPLTKVGQWGLISPFMRNGTLSAYLDQNPKADRLGLVCDVAEGVMYLHNTVLVVHGHLEPTNILVDDHGRAVLADFQLSTTIQADPESTDETIRSWCTVAYCAPELLCDEPEGRYTDPWARTTMTDIYAFGMVLYVTFGGILRPEYLFSWMLVAQIREGLLPPKPPPLHPVRYVCDKVWLLCMDCWAPDPVSRPSIKFVQESLQALCVPTAVRPFRPSIKLVQERLQALLPP